MFKRESGESGATSAGRAKRRWNRWDGDLDVGGVDLAPVVFSLSAANGLKATGLFFTGSDRLEDVFSSAVSLTS